MEVWESEFKAGVIAEGAIVELDTAGISDINGGGIVSHSWHLDNGAAIVGADAATYTLQAANLTLSEIRNGRFTFGSFVSGFVRL